MSGYSDSRPLLSQSSKLLFLTSRLRPSPVTMCFKKNRFNQIMMDHFRWLMQSVAIAHTFSDMDKARLAMGMLLHYHSTMTREICSCYVCTVITTVYDCGLHRWEFCEDQFNCVLCYHLVGEMVHILLPKEWPSWAKRPWSPLQDGFTM